jgi:hypothetical protein
MPLIRARVQDWSGDFAFAPPTKESLINTDDIQSVRPTESRGIGPFVKVRFRDGTELICVGTVADFLPGAEESDR